MRMRTSVFRRRSLYMCKETYGCVRDLQSLMGRTGSERECLRINRALSLEEAHNVERIREHVKRVSHVNWACLSCE